MSDPLEEIQAKLALVEEGLAKLCAPFPHEDTMRLSLLAVKRVFGEEAPEKFIDDVNKLLRRWPAISKVIRENTPARATRPYAGPPASLTESNEKLREAIAELKEETPVINPHVSEEKISQCLALIVQEQKASIPMLQRAFRLGYIEASNIMDILEKRGHIGPRKENSSAREVITK